MVDNWHTTTSQLINTQPKLASLPTHTLQAQVRNFAGVFSEPGNGAKLVDPRRSGRGRDDPHGSPPAQIRTIPEAT
jgi:hypothetical protein